MPEIADPPKKSFVQKMAEGRPANEAELKSGAVTPKPDEPVAAAPDKPIEPAKAAEPAKVAGTVKAVAAPAPDPDDEILTGKRIAKAEDFKRVKGLVGEFKTKAEQAEAKHAAALKELEAAKKEKAKPELVKQLESDRDKYKGMFEQVAVELTPEFHAGFESKLAAIKAVLPKESADQLMTLLQLPDSPAKRERVLELMADADAFTLAQVARADERVQEVLAEKRDKLAKAHETLGKIGAERQAKLTERQAAMAEGFTKQLSVAQDPEKGNILFQRREEKTAEDKAWNASVAEREQIARAIFEDKFESPSEKADAALWASVAPGLLTQLKQERTTYQAKIDELEATISKMTASNPNLGGAGGGDAGGSKRGGLVGKWKTDI